MQDARNRWPIFATLVAGISVASLLWYFVLTNPKGQAEPASGGQYVEGVLRAPERMNPLFAADNPTDRDIAALVFSGLVRLGPDGTPQPDLAERWEITGNGRRYVFFLRPGVAWQDDPRARLDADDVVFTFKAISDPAFKGDPVLAQIMQGVVVEARDPYTVEFRLEQPYAPFLAYMTVGILPEHLLSGLDANELYNAEFNARPVGTGPYRLASRSNDGVRLEANSWYYLGPPRVSDIELRVFSDESLVAEALQRGDLDGALLPPDTPAAALDAVRESEEFEMQELSGTSMYALYFNTRTPLFADAALRRSLVAGLNRQGVIEASPSGLGAPAGAGIPVTSWAYSPVELPAFDAGAAARELERDGWSRARDGVRRKGDLRLALTISTSNEPARVALAQEIARQWRTMGAEVLVQPLDAATFIEGHLLPRQFEAALVEVDPGPDPDPYPFWHSSQATSPGRNLSGYADPRIDDLLERARQTTDTSRRRELYELFAGFVIADMPVIPLYAPVSVYAQSKQLRGFQPSLLFSAASRFANVNEWYLRTRVRR